MKRNCLRVVVVVVVVVVVDVVALVAGMEGGTTNESDGGESITETGPT